jgi:hypothetical protein
MQCVNCEFENIPGVHQCARCQSVLELDGVAVEPPRAGPYRIASRLRRLANPISQGITWMPRPQKLPAIHAAWQPVAWSLVPGLGHIRHYDRNFGLFVLGAWLACLPLMLLSIGLALSWACVALAVLIHVLAVLSLLNVHLTRSVAASRTICGLFLFAGLWVFVYQPAGGVLHRCYIPLTVQGIWANSFVENGDTLLCQGPWLRPRAFQRGDLVVYRPAAPRGLAGGFAEASFAVDRIVGVPGDAIRIGDGRISVNGRTVGTTSPPSDPFLLAVVEGKVPESQYMIVPSGPQIPAPGAGGNTMGRCLVNQDDVLGRAVFRTNPLWRFGRIQ